MSSTTSRADKTVWVVGAGASISDSKGVFPSLMGIPAKARELGLLGDGTEPEIKHLASYLRSRFYGDLTNPLEPINLEHVLTLLEIDIAVSGEPKLHMARKYILRLLRSTLMRLHKNKPPSAGEYRRLVARLSPNDTIVSFNWDVLLDEAFGRTPRLQALDQELRDPPFADPPNRYDEFILSLTGWGERTIHGIGVPRPIDKLQDRGYYIKAHGSIDWYYCTNPSCRSFERIFPLLGSPRRPICSGCRERTEVLMIPPTLNKRLRDVPLTRRLWTLAASEFERATEIVAWGYSLPPTDFFSEWLLRHVKSSRCKRLVLINPDVIGNGELNTEFVQRFVGAVKLPTKRIGLDIFTSFQAYEEGQSAAEPAIKRQLRQLTGRLTSPTT
jgi:hypothetical protein